MPISTESFTKSTPQTRKAKGPLVRVELSPGRYAKMYRADVEAQGLTDKVHPADRDKLSRPQTDKTAPPAGDKMAPPQADKAAETTPPPEPDDFATIDGVGKATARALAAHGITTFDQLKAAGPLPYLTATVNEALEEWRRG